MGRLFKGIRTIIVIFEIVGALLSAIIFILNKIGVLKNISKKQPPPPENKK
ncbi:MAG TPA: hypothetical protein VND99_02910 [Candidatus Acidoferrales bacterium]|nr:hypothetical protein [Candidatus Acidoferrales bacterium]